VRQPPQLLADGEVVMTSAWNGRYLQTPMKGQASPSRSSGTGQAPGLDLWAIPKGTPKLEGAYRFLAFASGAVQRMAEQTKYIAYGPANADAAPNVDPTDPPSLPTAPDNLKTAWNP
jgi:putative spermidine/putrescine transport system substrate-binding protein